MGKFADQREIRLLRWNQYCLISTSAFHHQLLENIFDIEGEKYDINCNIKNQIILVTYVESFTAEVLHI